MYSYRAYELNISSYLSLPELTKHEGVTDVVIRRGFVAKPDGQLEGSVSGTASRRELVLRYSSGSFLVRNGREIIVDPVPGTTEEVLRLHLLGPALGGILHQRGLLVLHGSAVRVGGFAVGFIGPSGAGKSMLATSMSARGHDLVVDDVLAVRLDGKDAPSIASSFPQVKLWPDSLVALGSVPEQLERIHPEYEKRALRACDRFFHGSLHLHCVYALHQSTEWSVTTLSPADALLELIANTYVAKFLRPTQTQADHFRQCVVLARSMPVRCLCRPRSLEEIGKTLEIIDADLNAHPVVAPAGEFANA